MAGGIDIGGGGSTTLQLGMDASGAVTAGKQFEGAVNSVIATEKSALAQHRRIYADRLGAIRASYRQEVEAAERAMRARERASVSVAEVNQIRARYKEQVEAAQAASRAQIQAAQQAHLAATNGMRPMIAVTDEMTVATRRSGASLNTVRSALQGLLASTLHTAPGVAQVSGAIGTMAMGTTMMVGVLAAIAALAYGWQWLTREAKANKEASKEAIDELQRLRDAQANPHGLPTKSLDVARAEQKELERQLRGAEAGRVITSNQGGTRTVINQAEIADLKKQITVRVSLIQAGTLEESRIKNEAYAKGVELGQRETARLKQENDNRARDHKQMLDSKLQAEQKAFKDLQAIVASGAASWDEQNRLAEIYRSSRDVAADLSRTEAERAEALERMRAAMTAIQASYERVLPIARELAAKNFTKDGLYKPLMGGFITDPGTGPRTGSPTTGNSYTDSIGAGLSSMFDPKQILSGIVTSGFNVFLKGFTNFVSELANGGQAAKQAAEEYKRLRAAVQASVDSIRAQVTGDAVGLDLIRSRTMFGDARNSVKDTFNNRYPESSLSGRMKSSREYQDDVRARDAALKDLDVLEARHTAQIRKEYEDRKRHLGEDLEVRRLMATGQTDAANAMRLQLDQEREKNELIKAGIDEAVIAAVHFAEATKAAADAAEAAAENARKANEEARRSTFDAQRQFRTASLSATTAIEISAIEAALAKQAEQGADQVRLAEDALNVAREQLRVQEQAVAETRRVIETLSRFSASLKLGPQTILSPLSQAAEARRQYDQLLTAARGGDKTAAGQLPEMARALLDAKRTTHASGAGYVAEFEYVQTTIGEITARFGAQLTVEEQMLDELKKQTATMEAQIEQARAAAAAAQAQGEQQIAILRETMRLTLEMEERTGLTALVIAKLEDLRASANETGRAIIDGQLLSLRDSNESLRAATAAQVEAIRAGAPAHTVAILEQIRVLEMTKNEYNARATEEIAQLAGIYGWGSAQVAAAERQRVEFLAKYDQQISAIRDVTLAIQNMETSVAATDALLSKLDEIKVSVDAGARTMIEEQQRSLLESRNALQQATVAQVAAVREGAPAHVVAMLDQVRAIELLKNDYNTKTVQQISDLAGIRGWSSAQVAELEAQRVQYVQKFQEQIDAIRSIPDDFGREIEQPVVVGDDGNGTVTAIQAQTDALRQELEKQRLHLTSIIEGQAAEIRTLQDGFTRVVNSVDALVVSVDDQSRIIQREVA